ncbi:MAG: serine hydrolase domain-containing protein [Pyrinomonadaceae bacterium]
MRGDKVVFSKGFGVSSIETGAPVTTSTLFRIGSVTKMFTAAALLTLESEWRLGVSDSVGKYVGGLNAKLSQSTLHQLLTHTSGITDRVVDNGPQDESALGITIRGWNSDYVFTEPGRIFSYSNPGYALLGLTIEEAGKGPFANQMDKILFRPLGMKSTTFRPAVAMTFPLSQGHNAGDNSLPAVARPFSNNVVFWADGFMFSSVDDLSRFVIALMNEGRLEGKQIVPASVVQKMTTPYVDTVSFSKDEKYGYGLQFRNFRGIQVAEHGGSINGFGCLVRIALRERLAVIAVANKTDVAMDETVGRAFEEILGVRRVENRLAKNIDAMTAQQMKSYSGVYSNNFQTVELKVKDGKLLFGYGDSTLSVNKIGGNEFEAVLPNGDRLVNFFLIAGTSGEIEYLHSQGRALRKIS